MALKFGPDKRKGDKGRTTIDPRIGGKAGDAGPKFQKVGKQPRTKIYDTKISDRPDAGFSGSKKIIKPGSFGEAFAIAFAKKPGGTFTYKGKQYLAARKSAGKGPSKSRVEDKVSKATIIKGKRDTTKTKDSSLTAAVKKVKSKKTTPASGRFGQRKAGGIMKANDGTAVMKQAKKMAEEDRVTLQDLREAATMLKYKLVKEKVGPKARITQKDIAEGAKAQNSKKASDPRLGKRRGGVMKANLGAFMKIRNALQGITPSLSKAQREEFKMLLKDIKRVKEPVPVKAARRLNKKNLATVGTIGAGSLLLSEKKKTTKPKRKEDRVSQADIIGKGSKKGRRAGGMMKAKNGGFPDLSGDGKVTQKDILMGRGVIKKRGGGAAIKGMGFKGVL